MQEEEHQPERLHNMATHTSFLLMTCNQCWASCITHYQLLSFGSNTFLYSMCFTTFSSLQTNDKQKRLNMQPRTNLITTDYKTLNYHSECIVYHHSLYILISGPSLNLNYGRMGTNWDFITASEVESPLFLHLFCLSIRQIM